MSYAYRWAVPLPANLAVAVGTGREDKSDEIKFFGNTRSEVIRITYYYPIVSIITWKEMQRMEANPRWDMSNVTQRARTEKNACIILLIVTFVP